jgi:hypothetical protein
VSEEDAYMQAVSASIGPQVVGQIVSIAAKSNTQLSKDAPLFNEPYRGSRSPRPRPSSALRAIRPPP